MSDTLPIVIRAENPETDRAYVLSTWVRSFSESKLAEMAGRGSYWRGQHALATKLLSRCGGARIAAWNEDGDVIAGWACVGSGVTHYVYVREEFRRRGIARALLAGAPRTYSHRPRAAARIPRDWSFDPYAAFV